MSIIPLTLNNPATVVEEQKDFVVGGPAVLIKFLDRTQLSNPNRSIATYDLRVGKKYRNHLKQDGKDLAPGGKITLKPSETVIIQTEEWVHFPQCMFGYLIPRVSLLQDGISNTLSKIDPGYQGHLIVTVFNLGKKKVELLPQQAFCSLAIHRVEGNPALYRGGGKQIKGRVEAGWWTASWKWIDRNSGRLAMSLFLITILERAFGVLTSLAGLIDKINVLFTR